MSKENLIGSANQFLIVYFSYSTSMVDFINICAQNLTPFCRMAFVKFWLNFDWEIQSPSLWWNWMVFFPPNAVWWNRPIERFRDILIYVFLVFFLELLILEMTVLLQSVIACCCRLSSRCKLLINVIFTISFFLHLQTNHLDFNARKPLQTLKFSYLHFLFCLSLLLCIFYLPLKWLFYVKEFIINISIVCFVFDKVLILTRELWNMS